MRIYLTVSFNEKEEAKKIAKENGTKIQWDANKKKWFWEGGSLPVFLEKYTYNTRPQDYAKRAASFAKFDKSARGQKYKAKRIEISAKDHGFKSAADMEAEHRKNMDQLGKEIEDELKDCVFCSHCGWDGDNDCKKCPDCGRKL